MEIRPDYYDNFKCIAEKCQHNCCIGWEIDIDDDTLEKYQNQSGKLLEKLKNNISYSPCAHFVLGEKERCPFLNCNNLCELILEGGEDMLCQICKEHPRFYNEVYGITEKGIGLSCEEAARIILSRTEKFRLLHDCDIPSEDFFEERNEIFNILQNREKPIVERISELLDRLGVILPTAEIDWIGVYQNLERLDTEWDKYLDIADKIDFNIPEGLEIPCEQLLCYFTYRHLSGALEDFLFAERVQFAVLSCLLVANLSSNTEEFLEVARMYSSEIEYSDENINILLDILNEYNEK